MAASGGAVSDGCSGFQWTEWLFPATRACCEFHDEGGSNGALLDCLESVLPYWAYIIAAFFVAIMVLFRPLYQKLQRGDVMDRIIIHWTAGGNKANATDKKHYHVLIEGDGRVVLGDHPIKANAAPPAKAYAAHTLNCNTGSIGVSLCGMVGAVESPFKPGNAPITKVQFEAAIKEVARLAREYSIAVSPKTILTHAEVEANLGIKQRGKWDITILPWDTKVKGARVVGDLIRAGVSTHLSPPKPTEPAPKPAEPIPVTPLPERTPPAQNKATGVAIGFGAVIIFVAAIIWKGINP